MTKYVDIMLITMAEDKAEQLNGKINDLVSVQLFAKRFLKDDAHRHLMLIEAMQKLCKDFFDKKLSAQEFDTAFEDMFVLHHVSGEMLQRASEELDNSGDEILSHLFGDTKH